jgi:hypothetical protein
VRCARGAEVVLLTESKTCFLDWTVSTYVPGSTWGLEVRNRYQLACNKSLAPIKDSHYPTAVSNDVAVVSTIVQDDFCVSEILMVYKTVPQRDNGVYLI